jgi:tol-pal system protein YbgF
MLSRAALRAGARVLRAGLFALLLLTPLASGCAYLTSKAELKVNEIAQETRVLRSQQRDLTDEVARIRSLLEGEGLVGDEQRAELLSRLDALERAVAQMVARSEEQDTMLQRMAAALDQLARQGGVAPGGGAPGSGTLGSGPAQAGPLPGTAPATTSEGIAPPTATPPASVSEAPGAAVAGADSGAAPPIEEGSTELAIYDAARGDFARGNYALARDGFDELLRRFPASNLADNAAYWLAESYYAEAQYLQALERYEEILIAYPDGDVRPAALLKTGYCRLELGFPDEAARSFERVRLLFPDSNEAAIAEHKLSGLSESR